MAQTEHIPKIIHYFWFGKNPLPPIVIKCINSWKKFCPDYEIKRWDETNFDISICDYVSEAYGKKKWAFVSDYARFYILNKFGGVYLDTDVELIKPINSIINKGPFFALESDEYNSINPGIGMASYPNNSLYKKVLSSYNHDHFLDRNGFENKKTVGERVAFFLIRDGLKDKKGIQKVQDFLIYPREYFCPLNYFTGDLNITSNTVAIHHYSASWLTNTDKAIHRVGQIIAKISGRKNGERAEMLLRFPVMSLRKIKENGFIATFKYYRGKFNARKNK